MTVIRQDAEVYTVIAMVDADPRWMPELEAHAKNGLSVFCEFRGFLSGALHLSGDGGRLVQYLQWSTEADYLACINDSRWKDIASTRRFFEIVNSGNAHVDVRGYSIRLVSDSD